MQLFRSVELLIVKLEVQHISRMHFLKKNQNTQKKEKEEQSFAFSTMVDFN